MEKILVAFTNHRAPQIYRDMIQAFLDLYFQDFSAEMKKHNAFFNVKIDEKTFFTNFWICCNDEILKNKLSIKLDEVSPNYKGGN